MNNVLLYLVSLHADFDTKLAIRQCNRYMHDRIMKYGLIKKN